MSIEAKERNELKEERDEYKHYLKEIYIICDAVSTKETKDINEIWKITCIALGIEFDIEN